MMRGSSYLGSAPKRALSRPRRFGSLAAVFLIFAMLLSGFASIPLLKSLTSSTGGTAANGSTPLISDASALWCSDPKEGDLGLGMDNRRDWKSGSAWYPHSDTSGRILTTQEAFGNGIRFTNFNGVGKSPALPWFWVSPPVGLPQTDNDTDEGLKSVVSYTGNTPKGEGTENWYKNMNSSRTPTNCVGGAIGGSVANGILGITSGVTNLMGGIATFAFDPNFICKPDSNATNCIDLVGIIGGTGHSTDGGIIGKLTTSVYFPLLALVALLVGIYIIWNGLAKRQFRETFIGVIWSVLTVILGIALLLNPLLLAKAPMVVSNALASCVIGSFTGSNGCADGSNGTGVSNSPKAAYCEAWSSKSNFMDEAAITMKSMSCELWKAFVLQPYAQGSFGAPLDQLDTSNPDTIASKLIAKNPGFNSSTFCVDTKVKGTLDSQFGNTLDLTTSGDPICNLAVYQAYLGVDAKMDSGAGGAPAAAGSIDGRWLKIAQVAASDDGMYRSWAPSDLHLSQIGLAIIGLLSAILAAIVIFVVSAFALAFYVTSILMIAFAPFFLLVGVHPGRGRKIMIGWLGQVLSNIMKYAASAIFLVITVALYGAVLSNVSNPGAILIFMIILTVALLMYRREIVDMVGAIDLGGEKLSNKFAQATMDRVRNTGKTAMAVGAGVTAGALSNGSLNPFSVANWNPNTIGRNLKENLTAGVDSGRRSLKSRPGALGEVMKASDRISADNRADMARQSTAVVDQSKKATQARAAKEENYNDLTRELDSSRVTTNEQLDDLQEKNATATSRQFGAQAQVDQLGIAQTAALSSVDNPAFRQYQDLLNQMKNLEMKAVISEEAGRTEEAEGYRAEAQDMRFKLNDVQGGISDEDMATGRSQYSNALADGIDDSRVTPENVESYGNHVRNEYQGIMATIGSTADRAEKLKAQQESTEERLQNSIVSAREDVADAKSAESRADAAATESRKRVINLKPGQVVTNRDVRKNAQEIEAIQNDKSDDIRALSGTVEDRMLQSSEAHTDATDVRDSWSAEAATQREGIAESQAAARRLANVRNDLQSAKRSAAEDWKNAGTESPEDRAKAAYIDHIDAEAEAARAAARTEEISSREATEGGLSDLDRSNIFVARREEEIARARMASAERVISTSGSDMGAMRDELRRSIEAEYAQRPSAQSMSMEDGLESFEQNFDEAANGVRDELRQRQEALQAAQQNEALAARQAQLAQRESQRLAETARALREQASSNQPVTAREAERTAASATRATERASRATEGARGIPRPQSPSAPAAEEALEDAVVAPAPAPATPAPAPATPAPAPATPAPASTSAERAAVSAPQTPRVAPQAAPTPVAQPAPRVVQPPAQVAPRPTPAPATEPVRQAPPATPAPVAPAVTQPSVAPAPVAPAPAPVVPVPAAPAQGPSRAEREQAAERVRRAEAESQARFREAQEASSRALRDATDRRVNEINSSTENSLREIQSNRADLERSMDNLAGGTNSGRQYMEILDELDRVSSATELSDSQLRSALENISAESQELTEKVAGFSGRMAPRAQEVGQQIEDQISRIRALRSSEAQSPQTPSNGPSANTRGADDGNPFRGGNPFRR